MNLQAAQDLAKLREPQQVSVQPKVKTAVQVARRIFQLAAAGGFPYKNHTPESWAKKWMSSKTFMLMEIDINAAASPHMPKNPTRVQHYMHCSKDSFDPIVVDVNKRKVGKTLLGYTPEVVKLDGKHRSAALLAQGHTKVLAWVGCKAAKKIKPSKIMEVNASAVTTPTFDTPSKIGTAYQLFASVVPSVGIPSIRQDSGEGGSRPKDHLHSGKGLFKKKVKAKVEECDACGARSSGSLVDDSSNSDHKIPPDSSDTKQAVDTSDQLGWDGRQANVYAPGTRPGYADQFGSPNFQAPGSGVGQRVKNTGASNSDFSRELRAKGTKIPKIWNKKKRVKAVAPPGREAQVKALKPKVGKKAAFKIAWSQHNDGKH